MSIPCSRNIQNKISLSNSKTNQRLGWCSRDVWLPFPNKKNGYFPSPGDEREVAHQVRVRWKTLVEIGGNQELVASDTYESVEYLGVQSTREEECVFNVNVWGMDRVLMNRCDCAKVIVEGPARQISPQIPRYRAILRLNIGREAQSSPFIERVTTYRDIKQCTTMNDHFVCLVEKRGSEEQKVNDPVIQICVCMGL